VPQVQSTFACLDSLTSLKLEMSRLDFLLDGSWTSAKPLEAAKHFNTFLACAHNLEELWLDYHEFERQYRFNSELPVFDRQWPPALMDLDWLVQVLKDQHWSKLRNFKLIDFRVHARTLSEFLGTHRKSLKNLILRIDCGDDERDLQACLDTLQLETLQFVGADWD